MNVLIIDDEALVRIGLCSILRSYNGKYHVREASNGKEALEILPVFRPDVAFVDINMPIMDGLTFIEQAKKYGFATKFIVLTCYSDFPTVRQALRAGAADYIVKTSISEEGLLEILSGIRTEETEDEQDKQQYFVNNMLQNLATGFDPTPEMLERFAQKQDMPFLHGEFSVLALQSRKLQEVSCVGNREKRFRLVTRLYNLIHEFLKEYHGGFVQRTGNDLVVLLPTGMPGEGYLEEFCARLIQSAQSYLNIDLCFGVCCGASLANYAVSLQKAAEALDLGFYGDFNGVFIHHIDCAGRQSDLEAFAPGFRARLSECIRMAKYQEAAAMLGELSDFCRAGRCPSKEVRNFLFELYLIILDRIEHDEPEMQLSLSQKKCEDIILRDIAGFDEIVCILAGFLQDTARYCEQNTERFHDSVVRKSQEYVREFITGDTSLEAVARFVNLSPSYFSKLFSQKTGMTFVDYVVRQKIERAKELIARGEKVISVAEQLGYENYSYFCRLFKRVSGYSVQDFKQG